MDNAMKWLRNSDPDKTKLDDPTVEALRSLEWLRNDDFDPDKHPLSDTSLYALANLMTLLLGSVITGSLISKR
jgi:hypothetical protein